MLKRFVSVIGLALTLASCLALASCQNFNPSDMPNDCVHRPPCDLSGRPL